MAGYMPLHLPGEVITLTASGTITAGQAVVVSGSGTVAASAGASAAVVGHAATGVTSGQTVAVYGRGTVHEVLNTGGITAGARVDSAAAGVVASGAAGVNNIGIALTTALTGENVLYMEI